LSREEYWIVELQIGRVVERICGDFGLRNERGGLVANHQLPFNEIAERCLLAASKLPFALSDEIINSFPGTQGWPQYG